MLTSTRFLVAFLPFLFIACTIQFISSRTRTPANSGVVYYMRNDLPEDFVDEKQQKGEWNVV